MEADIEKKVKKTVLVLDAEQRSALAVTRAIGAVDDSYIITADTTGQALSGSSRFSDLYLQYPSPNHEPKEFIKWLSLVITQYSVDLLMPVTEITSQLILIYQDKLPDVEVPFADYQHLMVIADKANLVQIAKKYDVAVPQSFFYGNADEIDRIEIKFPCVLKPAFSHIFHDEKWISTMVRILYSEADLDDALEDDGYLQDHKFMIQEFIPGTGAGVFCYFDRGEAKVFFSHKRIREKPPSGGVSVLCESQQVPHELRLAAEKILGEQHWHGVAMVEFRIGDDGQAYLMEVNTRFWGSLQLAIDAGVNFPLWVYTTQLGLKQPEQVRFKTGQRLRWLLGDLDSLYICWKSSEYPLSRKLKQSFDFMFGNPVGCRHEVNRWGDMKPAVYELKRYLNDLTGNG